MKRLPKTLSAEALREVWRANRDATSSRAGAPGVDRISASKFSTNLQVNIDSLRREIRTGNFRFSRLRFAPVEKKSGGFRIICVPTVRDRLLQRGLLHHLENDPRFNASSAVSYGFTKGKNLKDAQLAAVGLRSRYPWVLQADIVKFFDKIPRNHLKSLVRKNVRSKNITSLLCAAIDCELETIGGHGAEIIRDSGIVDGIGLRQGMPVSPMLSNLLLKDFDMSLISGGYKTIRYADDIAIFAESRAQLLQALRLVQENLKRLDLSIPELEDRDKTVIRNPSEVVEFLGVDIKRDGSAYKLTFPARKIAKIESEMALTATLEQCAKNKRNVGQVVRWLDAFIVGHRGSMSVLGDEAKPFFDRIEAAKRKTIDKFIREIIGDKAANSLDDVRRAILGMQDFSTN